LFAHKYPLAKLANEAELLTTIQRRQMAFRASVDQTVGSAVFGGGKKSISAFKKLVRELEK